MLFIAFLTNAKTFPQKLEISGIIIFDFLILGTILITL